MKYVEIYKYANGADQLVGRIVFDGHWVHADPPGNRLLTNMIAAPIRIQGRTLTAQQTPLEWLEALGHVYNNAYVRATEVMS
jgi:hypothetical protein